MIQNLNLKLQNERTLLIRLGFYEFFVNLLFEVKWVRTDPEILPRRFQSTMNKKLLSDKRWK